MHSLSGAVSAHTNFLGLDFGVNNHLFASLSGESQKRLRLHLEPANMSSGKLLFEHEEQLRFIYFPLTGTVSLQRILAEGMTIEIGVVGREGAAGVTSLLGRARAVNRAVIQSPGTILRIRTGLLIEELARNPPFQKQILVYSTALMNMISQLSACNRLHSVRERFSRWLLMVHDRVISSEIPLTQDFIAHLLGSRRASITEVANELKQLNAIQLSRGHIRIMNRPPLEASACECYRLLRKEFASHLNGPTIIPRLSRR